MKTPRLELTPTLPLLAIAIGLTSLSSAQDVRRTDRPTSTQTSSTAGDRSPPAVASASAPTSDQAVYLASIDTEDRSLRRYAGKKLFNHQGAELGTIRDFIVHPPSNRVRYLVVSSGGLFGGMGNSLRLVPYEAVRRGSRGNLFEVEILQAAWLQVPPVSDEDYVVDRFNISPEHHQRMLQRFGPGERTAVDSGAATNDLAGLIRARAIRGRSVFAENRKVGDIENIIISLEHGTAAALLDSSGDFTGTRAKYIIPLSRLASTGTRPDRFTTTLTRADFARAQPSEFAGHTAAVQPRATSEPLLTPTEPPLTPTGRPSAPAPQAVSQPRAVSTPAQAQQDALAASAHAIRQAIDNDPVLTAENVHVMSETGRIVLRGAARNQSAKDGIEEAARRATPNVRIENQITVTTR